MIPFIVLVHKQKVEKMVQGLDELGGRTNFPPLSWPTNLSRHKMLTYEGTEPESPLDDWNNPQIAKRQLRQERINSIRQSSYYDSDLDEDDD
ncbi:hypothetical protein PsorP6_006610 [Peronosclerospora sorghi]|uniref:Uncharacterized protein n=1 Tax=Peronosclerospora sorghi TaxID=230839 RepID=A0ACC0W2D6_9STRA|nr:hypothetical protein PsorP6_006610 [Peronosclerospora sorghi]